MLNSYCLHDENKQNTEERGQLSKKFSPAAIINKKPRQKSKMVKNNEKKIKIMETGRLGGSVFSTRLESFGPHQYFTDEMDA